MSATLRPVRRWLNRGGSGNRKSGRRASTRTINAPSSTGWRPRLTVSTSGSSGIGAGEGRAERYPVRPRGQPEMGCDRRADVGKTAPQPDCAAAAAGGDAQHRHALAGMVGAAKRRIAAMIGGQHHEIAGGEPAERLGQAAVEGLE